MVVGVRQGDLSILKLLIIWDFHIELSLEFIQNDTGTKVSSEQRSCRCNHLVDERGQRPE